MFNDRYRRRTLLVKNDFKSRLLEQIPVDTKKYDEYWSEDCTGKIFFVQIFLNHSLRLLKPLSDILRLHG